MLVMRGFVISIVAVESSETYVKGRVLYNSVTGNK